MGPFLKSAHIYVLRNYLLSMLPVPICSMKMEKHSHQRSEGLGKCTERLVGIYAQTSFVCSNTLIYLMEYSDIEDADITQSDANNLWIFKKGMKFEVGAQSSIMLTQYCFRHLHTCSKCRQNYPCMHYWAKVTEY